MLSKKDEAIRYGIQNKNVIDRFNSKLELTPEGCILFKACAWDKRDKYRVFNIAFKKQYINVKAHRFAYALAYGFDSLPAGYLRGERDSLTINHICRNVRCVNPEHMEVITNEENGRDGAKNVKRKKVA